MKPPGWRLGSPEEGIALIPPGPSSGGPVSPHPLSPQVIGMEMDQMPCQVWSPGHVSYSDVGKLDRWGGGLGTDFRRTEG